MNEAGGNPNPRRPFFTIAAWFSLLVPFVAAGVAVVGSQPPGPERSKTPLLVLVGAFGTSFVAGCVSLWGIKANGVWVILPPALLGMLVSAIFEVIALILLGLSGLPPN
jgi:hypothetical protein